MKKRGVIIVFIIAVLLSSFSVSAFGTSPVGLAITVFPGESYTSYFRIYNSQETDFSVTLEVPEEISNIISLQKNSFEISANEKFTPAYFTVTIPENNPDEALPARIMVKEEPKKGSTVIAVVNVPFDFIINVSNVGKRMKSDLKYDYEKDGFVIFVKNQGGEVIDSISAIIDVNGKTLNAKLASLERREEKEIFIKRPETVKGVYEVHADITYDDKVIEIKKTLKIGTPEIKVLSITSPDFSLGSINEIVIGVNNDWNEDLEVEGNLEIKKEEKIIITSKFAGKISNGNQILKSYIETEQIEEGRHRLILTLTYDDAQMEFSKDILISKTSITFSDTTIKSTKNIKIAIIFLVVILILVVLYQKLKTQKKKKLHLIN